MELDNYKHMDQADLENLNAHLNTLLMERERKIIEALESSDLNGLKAALQDNKNKILSPKAWAKLSFKEMTEKDLEFFLYVRDLPNYSKYEQGKSLADPTKTEEALLEAMYNKALFIHFINHPELSIQLKNSIEYLAPSDDIPEDIIKELFDRKLIKPTREFIDDIINCGYDNYISYFLDTGKHKFTQNEYKTIYLNNWSIPNDNSILEKVKNQFPQYKDIPLNKVLEPLHDDYGINKSSRYKQFLKSDESLFLDILKNHPIAAEDIYYIAEICDEKPEYYSVRLEKFLKLIIEIFPEHMKSLHKAKTLVQSDELKPIFDKLIYFAELNRELKEKGITPKKLKM